MGKGKGSYKHWLLRVERGDILFKLTGVKEIPARSIYNEKLYIKFRVKFYISFYNYKYNRGGAGKPNNFMLLNYFRYRQFYLQMSNDFFKINIFFTSSFKINLNEKYKVNEDYLTIIQKKNKRVLCKNFVMFLFILKKSKIFEDLVYFVFPKRGMSGHNSILRPPYKNKKSRHHIGFEK